MKNEISNGDIGIVRKIGKVSGKKYMEVDFGEERVMRYQEGESWTLFMRMQLLHIKDKAPSIR